MRWLRRRVSAPGLHRELRDINERSCQAGAHQCCAPYVERDHATGLIGALLRRSTAAAPSTVTMPVITKTQKKIAGALND